MRRCIATLAVGEGVLHPKSLESCEHAAQRWDAELIVFREPVADCHPWWQKVFVIDRLQSYDHVLQLDADMLIARDCPNPFACCDPSRLGVCHDLQHRRQWRFGKWLQNQGRRWAEDLELPLPDPGEWLNAGFLLYGPRQLVGWFHLARAIGRIHDYPAWGLGDQSVLTILCKSFRIHDWLPNRWNCVHAGTHWRPDLPRRMRGTIYHFCGERSTRAARIESTTW